MNLENKTYYMSDINLVINTMIDALKYENRRVIDPKDINCYMKEAIKKFKEEDLNVIFYGTKTTQEEFDSEIEEYFIRYEDKYVLLPWVDQNDLIQGFRGTLPFDIIKVIAKKSRDSFLPKRSSQELEEFKKIDNLVMEDSIVSISNTMQELEEKILNVTKKIEKIRRNRVKN